MPQITAYLVANPFLVGVVVALLIVALIVWLDWDGRA